MTPSKLPALLGVICLAAVMVPIGGVNVMKASRRKIAYCTACQKKHSSYHFWGSARFLVCSRVYQARRKQAVNAVHASTREKRRKVIKAQSTKPPWTASLKDAMAVAPRGVHTAGWRILLQHVGDVDHTGARIVNALARADVNAMKVARRVLIDRGGVVGQPQTGVFLLAFCFLLYWSWPVMTFLTGLLDHAPETLWSVKVLAMELDRVMKLYAPFYVRNGILVDTPPGLRVCGRDKDRGGSKKRIDSLLGRLPAWHRCSAQLASEMTADTFQASVCMKIMQEAKVEAFRGGASDYGSLGFIRCLGLAFESTMIDNEEEWMWLRDMSRGIKRRLQTLGIYEYEEAQTCRKCLRASLTLTEYSLSDLVVFACLVDKTRLP